MLERFGLRQADLQHKVLAFKLAAGAVVGRRFTAAVGKMWRNRSGGTGQRERGDRYHNTDEGDFWIDKEGIPHWNGEELRHLREYKARVRLEYEALTGDSDYAREKRASFGLRLTRGLTGKAWDAIDHLLVDLDPLKVDGGHRLVVAALDKLDKAEVLQKQQRFDDFFKRCTRKHGQGIADYIRERERKYSELRELDKTTQLSDDLYAYFLLEGARLQDSQKKLVTLVADSEFDTTAFKKTLTTNFHDLHLTERRAGRDDHQERWHGKPRFGGRRREKDRALWAGESEDEEEGPSEEESEGSFEEVDAAESETVPSDEGASQDEELMEAYVSYDKARQNLRTQQRERGFYKKKPLQQRGQRTPEERRAAIAAQKKKSRCGACGGIGHWAGDPECPKKGGGKGAQGRGGARKKERAEQSYFTIDDGHEMFESTVFAADAGSASSGWQTITSPPVAAQEGADAAEERRKEKVRHALMELRTVKELKAELRDLGLPVSGLKADLVARLFRATGGRTSG